MAERFVQWSGVHFSDGGGFIFKGRGCSMGGIGLNGRVFEKNYNLRGGGGGVRGLRPTMENPELESTSDFFPALPSL